MENGGEEGFGWDELALMAKTWGLVLVNVLAGLLMSYGAKELGVRMSELAGIGLVALGMMGATRGKYPLVYLGNIILGQTD